MGHRVIERRQFLPVQLDDGRQMVVPVDQVEFTPVPTSVILTSNSLELKSFDTFAIAKG